MENRLTWSGPVKWIPPIGQYALVRLLERVDSLASELAARPSDWSSRPRASLRRWRVALEVEYLVIMLGIGFLFQHAFRDAMVWVFVGAVEVLFGVFLWLLLDHRRAAYKWLILGLPALALLPFLLAFVTTR